MPVLTGGTLNVLAPQLEKMNPVFSIPALSGVPEKTLGAPSFESDQYNDPFAPPPKFNDYLSGPGSQYATSSNATTPQSYIPGQGVGTLGGEYSVLDQYNQAFQSAAAQYGFDANYLKSIAATERGWEGTSVAGAQGIMQIVPGGYPELEAKYPGWQTDPAQNIALGAAILRAKVNENGGDLGLGTQRYLGVGSDAYGTTTQQYLARVNDFYQRLSGSTVAPINGQWGGNATGNSIVSIAEQYIGTPYVWGGIPGKGAYPSGGWDCSGFTFWLDQNYGNGQLPRGSHYQYQQARDSGRLFMDMGQLQPGDLVFFDTGNTAGGGAELNNAGHVAMYIGNGQIIHAANPQDGTVISPLSEYYTSRFIGAEHMAWSGGYGGVAGSQSIQGATFGQTLRDFAKRWQANR